MSIQHLFRRFKLRNADPGSLVFALLLTAPIGVVAWVLDFYVSSHVSLLVTLLVLSFVHFYFSYRWKEGCYSAIDSHLAHTSALTQLLSLPLSVQLPLTHMSMMPEDLMDLSGQIILKRPALIVECGSGVSTIVLAYWLRTLGEGSLISIEHDKRWSELMRNLVSRNGFSDICQVVFAPLCHEKSRNDQLWYDQTKLNGLFAETEIDLLLIDGPPRSSGPWARYPALPYFMDKLSHNAEIILDDMNRVDEQQIAERWLDETLARVVSKSRTGRVWNFRLMKSDHMVR